MHAAENISPSQSLRRPWTRLSPLIVLLVVLVALPLILSVTVTMPIGPMYWDHFIYLDAANRIGDGQMPSVDFFTPVGALGYYLYTLVALIFPNGHPLLIASWCLLLVTAPLMALVLREVQARSTGLALALLGPFLLFSLLPFNTGDFYPFPGTDGFGIYNRQICQLLYVLAAALIFLRSQTLLGIIVFLSMLALFFIKVTGLVSGGLLCLMAFASGRLGLRAAIGAGLAFLASLAALELVFGLVSAYAVDIEALLGVNETSLLPRLLQAMSLNFGVLLPTGLLVLALFFTQWSDWRRALQQLATERSLATVKRAIGQPFLWVGVFAVAGILFESQNTGSQAFIFLWPLVLGLTTALWKRTGATAATITVCVLGAAVVLPPAVVISQKAARAFVGGLANIPIPNTHLGTMGAVGVRREFTERAVRMRENYIAHRDTYEALTRAGELHAFILFSEFDFQSLWLQNLDEAIGAVLKLEVDHNMRFETILNIDFTSPVAWAMQRHAPLHVAIGADPFRAVPPPDGEVAKAVAAVDIALYPTCPPTTTREKLLALYGPFLAPNHDRITLTPCFDAFVRRGLLPSSP